MTCTPGLAGQFGSFIYSESGGKITITGLVNFGTGATGTIPGSINGKPVTAIGESALGGSVFESVTIPNSVTTIGYGAFNVSFYLSSLNLGTGVTRIDDNAFYLCSRLQNLTLPSSLTSVGNFAFASCALKHVTIPAKLTHIGNLPFAYCNLLTSLSVDPLNPVFSGDGISCFDKAKTTLVLCPSGYDGTYVVPGTVTIIGANAFAGNTVLDDVVITPKVTQIQDGAFFYCQHLMGIHVDAKNSMYSTVDGVCFDKGETTLVAYPNGRTGNYVVPDTVTMIGNQAFAGANLLRTIQLPAPSS